MGTFCKEKKRYRIAGCETLMTYDRAKKLESERSGSALVSLVKAGKEAACRTSPFDVVKFTSFLMTNADKVSAALPRQIEEVRVFETLDGHEFSSMEEARGYAMDIATAQLRQAFADNNIMSIDAKTARALAHVMVEDAEAFHSPLHALLCFATPEPPNVQEEDDPDELA